MLPYSFCQFPVPLRLAGGLVWRRLLWSCRAGNLELVLFDIFCSFARHLKTIRKLPISEPKDLCAHAGVGLWSRGSLPERGKTLGKKPTGLPACASQPLAALAEFQNTRSDLWCDQLRKSNLQAFWITFYLLIPEKSTEVDLCLRFSATTTPFAQLFYHCPEQVCFSLYFQPLHLRGHSDILFGADQFLQGCGLAATTCGDCFFRNPFDWKLKSLYMDQNIKTGQGNQASCTLRWPSDPGFGIKAGRGLQCKAALWRWLGEGDFHRGAGDCGATVRRPYSTTVAYGFSSGWVANVGRWRPCPSNWKNCDQSGAHWRLEDEVYTYVIMFCWRRSLVIIGNI